MFCRAKISVLLPLIGALAAAGASFNPEQRNATFQPGANSGLTIAAVRRPAESTIQTKHWSGASVQKIIPSAHTLAWVDMKGITFTKARDAGITPGPVKQAGGGR